MKNNHISLLTVLLLMLAAAFSRIIPHPLNFSSVSALTLFGVAYFQRKHWAILAAFAATLISDLVINQVLYAGRYEVFYTGFYWQYLSYGLIAVAGILLLKKVSMFRILGASLSASAIFFLVSNLGCWALDSTIYTKDFKGLMLCYEAGLPFLQNTITGDLFYSAALFGAYALLSQQIPALKYQKA